MISFVLSGGGCRGALQAGALLALLEAGIRPDFFVATSVGALNSLYLASHGVTVDTAQSLQKMWLKVNKRDVFPGNALTAAFRFLRGKDSLYAGTAMRAFMSKQLPSKTITFGDLEVPCYFTASDLRTKRLFLFGEYPTFPCLEAAVASASIPVMLPPFDYQNLQLVDGGIIENVPSDIAMDKGATTIYCLNVGYGGQRLAPASGIVDIFNRMMGVMMAQSLFQDLEQARSDPAIELHHIHLNAHQDVPILDFSRSRQMFESGLQMTRAYLQSPLPLRIQKTEFPEFVTTARIPGGREWHSPNRAEID